MTFRTMSSHVVLRLLELNFLPKRVVSRGFFKNLCNGTSRVSLLSCYKQSFFFLCVSALLSLVRAFTFHAESESVHHRSFQQCGEKREKKQRTPKRLLSTWTGLNLELSAMVSDRKGVTSNRFSSWCDNYDP